MEEKKKMAITREDVLNYIESANMLEISDLVKEIENKFGVSAAPVAYAAGPQAAGEAAVVEEKTSFDVILSTVGEKKIQVIKEVRAITSLPPFHVVFPTGKPARPAALMFASVPSSL